jgi:hypothetical protein
VPARAIQHQHRDGTGADAATDHGQVLVHGLDIDLWHDDGSTDAALRTDRAEQIGPFEASVARGSGA